VKPKGRNWWIESCICYLFEEWKKKSNNWNRFM